MLFVALFRSALGPSMLGVKKPSIDRPDVLEVLVLVAHVVLLEAPGRRDHVELDVVRGQGLAVRAVSNATASN
jgi:hypothetical protein